MTDWLKKPSTTGGIVYLVVAGLVVVSLAVAATGKWRSGVTLMGLTFLLAFCVRAVLPDERAGMLKVRRRLVDLTVLALCAATMLILAVLVPGHD